MYVSVPLKPDVPMDVSRYTDIINYRALLFYQWEL